MLSFTQKHRLTIRDMTLFAMLGAVMYLTKFLMQALPNIHLLALFIAATTLTYRGKALIPLYVYILIDGVISGFALWWLPYLYIWLPLWGAVMLISKVKAPQKIMAPIYMTICGLHGLGFGLMYAPFQAIVFGLDFKGMVAWIAAGLPFDALHGVSNFFCAALVLPLHTLMRKLKHNNIMIS